MVQFNSTFRRLATLFLRALSVPHLSNAAAAASNGPRVLILGGGVSGVIAARTLHQSGIDNFVIVEARDELGGRMMTTTFGGKTIEQGANWIQGTQTGKGPANPIFTLAKKHNVSTQLNDWSGSVTTFDTTGAVDWLDVFDASGDDFDDMTVAAGARVDQNLVDLSARTGYSLIKAKPKTDQERAAEYYQYDWEYAQTPEESSLIASAWGNNFTYNTDQGGFSEDNLMSIDQRGFKALIQLEAQDFLTPSQIQLNSVVKNITYSKSGVTVTLTNGKTLTGDYALCTFSLGVLQNDDVKFQPELPDFKQEAIQSMVMGTFTKIFLKFPKKFWFDTEMGIFADSTRGRYPVWQSLDHPNFFPGSGILFVTVTGDFSIRIEALSDQKVQAEVMEVVRMMYPNITVPEPSEFFFPRWHTNTLFRGSYSNWPPALSSQHIDNLRANVGRLYFSGEATSRKYFGFLQGAYFEGQTAANNILACIKGPTCANLEHFTQINNVLPYENN
ncbi:hypothetical protein HYPSUDRAFT_194639 [Hypholoma sublateritium FD-334 SS-4]|uniref:Amine oxidase n=1 Tax=Hypholoma sublateritium (strain FD-334 SS-4) TaxID=945553 RepID=A0A0D2NER8_HYPSF|nr:hypothetical protein HYPSUDRAFT_194639 [Hypholoma sublateritium FD-334 SS-4]